MDPLSPIRQAIRSMIEVTDEQLDYFLKDCYVRTYKKKDLINKPFTVPNAVYFVNKGLIRVFVVDRQGQENTLHFAYENLFFADYAAFLQKKPTVEHLQALEPTEVVVLPREVVEYNYANLPQGDRLGRLIAEYYFIYLDSRIKGIHTLTPKERYNAITEVFPAIHQRAPQHMIASYLGITSVHLSRLKKDG